jgi:cellulose synthase/poly-beta-1,6-N-acetylglucosamine synthase-like glycosyltransferase
LSSPLPAAGPAVTALVPAHNEEATIGQTVAAIRDSTYPVARILVVADSCRDATASVAGAAGATVVATRFADKASNLNHVLPLVDTELVVGFDADTIPRRDCIERLVDRLRRDDLAAGCATVLPLQPRGLFVRGRRYAYALGRRWWRAAQSAVGRLQVLTGAAYLFRTSVLVDVGGFSSVGISSDMDTTWSFHSAGHRVGFAGDAVAYTVDPETFTEYRQQVSRWAAGYFQTMAKHRRQVCHPRSLLVVWTALFDLLCLPFALAGVAVHVAHDPGVARLYGLYLLGHTVVATALVATVVGAREAVLGVVPYATLNVYNKWAYLKAFVREWVLDSHHQGWTGRHAGRSADVTPVPRERVVLLVWWLALAVAAYGCVFGTRLPPFWLVVIALLAAPGIAMFSVPDPWR